MSATAVHESRRERYNCQRCRERKARFRYRGTVRADRDHTLCFECFRAERERQRARMFTETTAPPALEVRRVLGEKQITHRLAMLRNLERHQGDGVRP